MSINTWMDKEVMVYIHNGILIVKRNTSESVLMRWMNLEPIIQSEVSQKEKDKYHSNAYIQNLEKRYWRVSLQGSSGETDIENRFMDMGRGEERVRCMDRVTWKITFSSVQFSSVAQSCPTLCDPMNHSTPGLPVHHQLPEFTQTHVHRVSEISGEITPERMKGWSQSKNNTHLWMWLVIEAKSDTVKSNIA